MMEIQDLEKNLKYMGDVKDLGVSNPPLGGNGG